MMYKGLILVYKNYDDYYYYYNKSQLYVQFLSFKLLLYFAFR